MCLLFGGEVKGRGYDEIFYFLVQLMWNIHTCVSLATWS